MIKLRGILDTEKIAIIAEDIKIADIEVVRSAKEYSFRCMSSNIAVIKIDLDKVDMSDIEEVADMIIIKIKEIKTLLKLLILAIHNDDDSMLSIMFKLGDMGLSIKK